MSGVKGAVGSTVGGLAGTISGMLGTVASGLGTPLPGVAPRSGSPNPAGAIAAPTTTTTLPLGGVVNWVTTPVVNLVGPVLHLLGAP